MSDINKLIEQGLFEADINEAIDANLKNQPPRQEGGQLLSPETLAEGQKTPEGQSITAAEKLKMQKSVEITRDAGKFAEKAVSMIRGFEIAKQRAFQSKEGKLPTAEEMMKASKDRKEDYARDSRQMIEAFVEQMAPLEADIPTALKVLAEQIKVLHKGIWQEKQKMENESILRIEAGKTIKEANLDRQAGAATKVGEELAAQARMLQSQAAEVDAFADQIMMQANARRSRANGKPASGQVAR